MCVNLQSRPYCIFPLSTSLSQVTFELVHSDVWGPALVDSYNHFKYFIIFIDDFSCTTWIYLLKGKMKFFLCFKDFLNFVENQYNSKIKNFRSDNGTEYVNKKISELLSQKVFCIKPRVLTHPNKMTFQKEKTFIF
jgi:Integrase core domain